VLEMDWRLDMSKTFICPLPYVWNDIHKVLCNACLRKPGIPEPPMLLVLGGWNYSSDFIKQLRWQETLVWAEKYGFEHLIPKLKPDQIYEVDERVMTHHIIPIFPGDEHPDWNYEARIRPSDEEACQALAKLRSEWEDLAGPEMTNNTRPDRFTGNKLRRLVVRVSPQTGQPPWGTWDDLSNDPIRRRNFTEFRKRVNACIDPFEVDHIDFELKEEVL
jgi:hypothetical protein